jgi:hypothetical protein
MIAEIKAGWVNLSDLDTDNPGIGITFHCYDERDGRLTGYSCQWFSWWRDLSASRRELIGPLVDAVRLGAAGILKQYDPRPQQDPKAVDAPVIMLVQFARYGEGGTGVNIKRDYGEGREFAGQLAFEQRTDLPMKLNQRGVVDVAVQADIQAIINTWLDQADVVAWKLRVERI